MFYFHEKVNSKLTLRNVDCLTEVDVSYVKVDKVESIDCTGAEEAMPVRKSVCTVEVNST